MQAPWTRAFGWACVVSLMSVPALAQTAGTQSPETPPGDAYYEFFRALVLESRNDEAGAEAALQRAAGLDPQSAQVKAALASLALARDNGLAARQAAEQAVALDPRNADAHRVLGLLDASEVDFEVTGPAPAVTPRVESAIAHLDRIAETPASATDLSVQFTLGRLYLLARQYDKAVVVLQRVVNQQPESVDARVVLAEAFAGGQRVAEAIEVLEPAAEQNGTLDPTLAQLYERAGRARDAADAYQRAVTQAPSNRQLRLRWAAALLALPGRDSGAKARDALAPLTAANTGDTRAWYLLAEAERKAGDFAAAEAAARRVIALDPRAPWGAYALAHVFEDQHDYARVISTLQPLTTGGSGADSSDLLPVMVTLANAQQVVGDHRGATATMTRAAQIGPDDLAIQAALVQTYIGARRFDAARDLAARFEVTAPDDLRFPRLHARALVGLGRAEEAVALLEHARPRFAAHPPYWEALADACADAKRIADAERVLDEATRRFPGVASIEFERGVVYDKAKRFAEAETAFRRAIALEADNADALNYLGYMLAERGERLDEAVTLITRALDVDPGNPSYLDSLGWAQFRRGELGIAERYLRQAAGVLLANSVVQDHLAQVLFRTGRYAEAVSAWERALAGDRDSIDPAQLQRGLAEARGKAVRK